MKKLVALVSPILLFLTISCTTTVAVVKTVFSGTIQFPRHVATLPDMRLYYSGHILKSEKNASRNSISFSFPEDKRKTEFYVVITETITFTSQDNTICYIKIPAGKPSKAYHLSLVKT